MLNPRFDSTVQKLQQDQMALVIACFKDRTDDTIEWPTLNSYALARLELIPWQPDDTFDFAGLECVNDFTGQKRRTITRADKRADAECRKDPTPFLGHAIRCDEDISGKQRSLGIESLTRVTDTLFQKRAIDREALPFEIRDRERLAVWFGPDDNPVCRFRSVPHADPP
jgi:hypothetical protein